MNLRQAILDCYDVNIAEPPEDWRSRLFPIDRFRFGFALSAPGVKIFGCRSDGDIYYLCDGEWLGMKAKVLMPEKQRFNRTIIACARELIARGDVLTGADEARLKVAVQQVEISS